MDTETTENQEDLNIPPDVMFEVVSLCVIGYSRSEIAKMYINQQPRPQWLLPIQYHRDTLKVQLLAQRFRQADPRDTKFAATKYGQHQQQCEAAYNRQLDAHYDELIYELLTEHFNTDPETADLIRQLKQKLRQAVKDGLIEIKTKIPTKQQHN